MNATEPYIAIEKQIERLTLDELLTRYADDKEKRRVLEIRIHTAQEALTQDESLELVDQWGTLDDDCQALATAIADRFLAQRRTTQPEKELTHT